MSVKFKNIAIIAVVAVLSLGFYNFKSSSYFEISKNLDIFASLYKELNTYYVDDIEPADLMRKGIDAMLKSLDPYTNYISEAEMEGYKMKTTGKYGGIGAAIRKVDDYVIITEPYEGFAAFKAGLRAGDKIKEIEGKSAKGKSSNQVSKILRGSPGTDVKIKIERPQEKADIPIKLTREEVKIKSVPHYSEVADGIGYVKLRSFTQNCSADVIKAIRALKKEEKINKLILDLRGNPGGLLNEAVNVSNIFIPKDKEVVSTKGKNKDWNKTYKTMRAPVDLKMPVVVLTNGSSASASEIVSGVIQDYDRGVIVGQKTFGKGLVQTTKNVGYNSKVKLTTSKYYIPSGRCIQKINYADKDENGKAIKMPDSLKTAFKTANGRTVYDGVGVDPDILTEIKEFAHVSRTLLNKQLIFNYATEFAIKNKKIAEAKQFKLTDAEFNKFVQYVKDKDYKYDTKSEKLLESLTETTEKEKYFDALKNEIAVMKKKIKADKEKDIFKHKAEIKKMLEAEIVSRYYFKKGKIEHGLKSDVEVLKAIEILNNKTEYKKILAGK